MDKCLSRKIAKNCRSHSSFSVNVTYQALQGGDNGSASSPSSVTSRPPFSWRHARANTPCRSVTHRIQACRRDTQSSSYRFQANWVDLQQVCKFCEASSPYHPRPPLLSLCLWRLTSPRPPPLSPPSRKSSYMIRYHDARRCAAQHIRRFAINFPIQRRFFFSLQNVIKPSTVILQSWCI